MTPLRQRMIEDMTLRDLSPHTVEAYVRAVAQFAQHFGRSPEHLSGEDARRYLLHLVQQRHVSWSHYNLARRGLQFFFQVTLGRDEHFEKIPCARTPRRLPTVPPFGGPGHVPKYLARYTHRIAIGNRRLVSIDDRNVTFRWNDYAHGRRPRTTTLDGGEFLRRFLMHAVPRGFMRIRHFGLLANRVRARNLATCRRLLSAPPPAPATSGDHSADGPRCPLCGRGRLIAGPNLPPGQLARVLLRLDSS